MKSSCENKYRSPYAEAELNDATNHQTTRSILDKSKSAPDVNVWEAIQNVSKKCNVEYVEAFQFLFDCDLNESKAVEKLLKVLPCPKYPNKTGRDDNSNVDASKVGSCKTLQFTNVRKSKMTPHLTESGGDSLKSCGSSMILSPCTSGTEVQVNDLALSSRSTEATLSDEGDVNITIDSTESSMANGDSNVCKMPNNLQCPYPNLNHPNMEVNTEGEASWNGASACYQYPNDNGPAMFFPSGYMVHPAQNYCPMYGFAPTIHGGLCNINTGKNHRHQGISGFESPLYVPCYPPPYHSFPLWAVPRHFPYFVYGSGHVHIPGPCF